MLEHPSNHTKNAVGHDTKGNCFFMANCPQPQRMIGVEGREEVSFKPRSVILKKGVDRISSGSNK